MKNLYFDDFEDLVDDICDKFKTIDGQNNDISIVAKYEEAKQIVAELIYAGYDIRSIELCDEDCNGYNSEYLITLYSDEDVNELWCCPMATNDGNYITDESTIAYVLDNCSSAVIPYCNSPIRFEVTVGEEEYNEEDECEDCSECDKNEVSTSDTHSYKINGKSVSKEEFEKVESEFNDVLKKNLISMYEIIDEMNEWRKLFRW